ncbi:MAG TPA: segregation/condensation protein A [Solirubrobacteraceae bacterium]|nr:segregation/condensation protein A [Solirubrobacteraceae bacterium]
MRIAELEFDLEVFSGPFDLLLTLVLREEVDLRELSVAEVVVSYIDHLAARGELDLEVTTEFIVLIAALLELKSRLLLPGEELDELLDLEPTAAAEELLQRMLEARRYRSAAAHLAERVARAPAVRYREAALPPQLRRADLEDAPAGLWRAESLGRAIAGLLVRPPALDLSHVLVARVSVAERISHLRALLRRAAELSFEDAVSGADRMTVAVTVFALLELYKRGELSWDQDEPFGEITVRSLRPAAGARR